LNLKKHKFLKIALIFILVIPIYTYARHFTITAGIINNNINGFHEFETYYTDYDLGRYYFKYNQYLNTNIRNTIEFGNSLSLYNPISKNTKIYGKLNLGFIPSFYPALIAYKSIGLTYKNCYFGIQHNRYSENVEYGASIYIYKRFNFPFYFVISGSILNQSGIKENHINDVQLYNKLDYECGLDFKEIQFSYSGYKILNHAYFIEESLLRNYINLKIKFRKNDNTKYWSINYFIGNTYDIDVNNESNKYMKTIRNMVSGISVTF